MLRPIFSKGAYYRKVQGLKMKYLTLVILGLKLKLDYRIVSFQMDFLDTYLNRKEKKDWGTITGVKQELARRKQSVEVKSG